MTGDEPTAEQRETAPGSVATGPAAPGADSTIDEDQFTEWLIESERALREGAAVTTPRAGFANEPTPDMLRKMEQGLAGLELVNQLFGRRSSESDAPTDRPIPWQRLGRFEILRELGRGGFGVVFLARDPVLGRDVALKVPRTDGLLTPEVRERFQREARTASGLEHPHLVPIYEAGEIGPVCYIVSGYCPGITLAQWLRDRTQPVPFADAARLIATLADAIEHAHQRGVIHRDIKPANILLQRTVDGPHRTAPEERAESGPVPDNAADDDLAHFLPRIADFGLAKNLVDQASSAATRSGALLGTVNYMAPEQAAGRINDVGPATDTYALGATLYEMLTGRPPFRGESQVDTLQQIRFEEPLSPAKLRPKLPRDLETICLKCLIKEPSRRYETSADLAEDLRRFLADRPIQARRATLIERAWRLCRRNPLPFLFGGALLLVLILALIGSIIVAGRLTFENRRVVNAERATKEELYRAYASEATARRRGTAPGRRASSLEALSKALELRSELGDIDGLPGRLQLRNEMLACLMLPDLELDAEWERHPAETTKIVFDRSMQWFARGERGGTIHVGRIADADGAFMLPESYPRMRRLRLSPDGKRLAVVDADRRLRIWDVAAHTPIEVSIAQVGNDTLDFGGDHLLAVSHADGAITLIESATGQVARRLEPIARFPPQIIACSPAGGRLGVASRNQKRLVVRSTVDGSIVFDRTVAEDISCLAWSADGAWLAVGNYNPDIEILHADSGETHRVLTGHRSVIDQLAFHPSGKLLASTAWDGSLRLWDTGTGRELYQTMTATTDLRFSADGSRLGAQIRGNRIGLWRVAAAREYRTLATSDNPRNSGFDEISISPDGRLLAAAAYNGTCLWDLATETQIARLPARNGISVLFSEDGKALYTGDDDELRRWPIHAEGSNPGRLVVGPPETLRKGPIQHLSRSERGGLIAAGMPYRGAAVFGTGRAPGEEPILEHLNGVFVAVSPGARWIATSTWHGNGVRIWDPASARQLHALLPDETVNRVTFSPDERWLVTCSMDGFRFWKSGSWELDRFIPREHSAVPGSIAFDSGSRIAALQVTPSLVRLLDVERNLELATIEMPPSELLGETLFDRAGGRLLIVAGGESTIHVLDLRLLRRALAQAGLDWDTPQIPPLPATPEAPLVLEVRQ